MWVGIGTATRTGVLRLERLSMVWVLLLLTVYASSSRRGVCECRWRGSGGDPPRIDFANVAWTGKRMRGVGHGRGHGWRAGGTGEAAGIEVENPSSWNSSASRRLVEFVLSEVGRREKQERGRSMSKLPKMVERRR